MYNPQHIIIKSKWVSRKTLNYLNNNRKLVSKVGKIILQAIILIYIVILILILVKV